MHYVLSTCVVARKLSGIGLQPRRKAAEELLLDACAFRH
jgi:hypothetical protein